MKAGVNDMPPTTQQSQDCASCGFTAGAVKRRYGKQVLRQHIPKVTEKRPADILYSSVARQTGEVCMPSRPGWGGYGCGRVGGGGTPLDGGGRQGGVRAAASAAFRAAGDRSAAIKPRMTTSTSIRGPSKACK